MKFLSHMAKAAVILIFLSTAIVSQTNTGHLTGTVYDVSGSVVPHAQVVVTDNRTMHERHAQSDDKGVFAVPFLDVGAYTAIIAKPGFNSLKVTDLIVAVGRETSIGAVLQVGGAETVMVVASHAGGIDATKAEISFTVGSKQIQGLPLDGRNPLDLILLQAGVASSPTQNVSINGQRPSFTNITRDGINIQDAYLRTNATGFAPGRPAVDDVEEFTITNQNAGADQGYGAAQVRLATRRGSSEYHGGIWEFNRNSSLGANDFFNNRAGIRKPFRNRNQFGGNLGGPVPGVDGRLLFFGFYEVLRDVRSVSATRTLLLPDARKGVFSYRASQNGETTTRKIDLLGLVPEVSRIDPSVSARILDRMPATGNRPDIGDGLNTTGIAFNQPSNTDRDVFTTRIDYAVNNAHGLSLTLTRNKETNQRPDQNNTEGFYAVHPIVQSSTNHQVTAAHRWVRSSSFTNELRGGLFFSDVPFNRTIPRPDVFLTPPSLISNPDVTHLDQGRKVHTYNLQDHAEKLMGGHRFRFGGQLQMFQVDPWNYTGVVPTFSFGTNPNTPTLNTSMFGGNISQNQFADATALFSLLGGILSSGTQSFNMRTRDSGFDNSPRTEDFRYSDYSFYVDHQWHPTRGLTINAGVRYELLTPVRLLNGLALEPVIPPGMNATEALLNPNGVFDYVGGNAGGGNRLYRTDWNNVAPVLGFAYSPHSRNRLLKALFGAERGDTVVRGGFRQSYVNDSNLSAASFAISGNYGMGTTQASAVDPSTGSTQLNARPDALPTIAPPEATVPRTYLQNNGAQSGNFGIAYVIDPDIRTARVDEYSLAIQRALGWGLGFEIRYVGNRSGNLWRGADLNQIDLRDNGFAADFNRARQNLLVNGNPSVGAPLTVFPLLSNGGNLGNATVRGYLQRGVPADLALMYITGRQTGSVRFQPNPNIGVADLLSNSAKHRYDSLQLELSKRFSPDLWFQANYTWQKTLTNAIGTSATLTDMYLDVANPDLEYARADYDLTHIVNVSSIYALPFGRGRRLTDASRRWIGPLLGGWEVATIVRWNSGSPITFVDPRGTFNRSARATRQTPNSPLSHEQIRALTGHFEDAGGIYFINPSVLNADGRAAAGYGTSFPGQAFFNAAPGETGALGRAIVDGPSYFTIDASVTKRIGITEKAALQLKVDAFNALNNTSFYLKNQLQDVNSSSFGKLLAARNPRVIQMAVRLTF